VYCAEVNVVLTRRLWPRSIVQPPLTEADRTSLALRALESQQRKEQEVHVMFEGVEHPATPAPPAPPVAPPARTPPDDRDETRDLGRSGT